MKAAVAVAAAVVAAVDLRAVVLVSLSSMSPTSVDGVKYCNELYVITTQLP